MNGRRLALGTAQFGFPYGVSNRAGQVPLEEAASILKTAWAAGVDTLDTAIVYGESEKRLGEIGVESWQVVTKLPVIPESCSDLARWAQESVNGSLERLKIPRLRGLILHRSDQFLGERGDALFKALSQLKKNGLVEKIGVSIYDPAELEPLWPRYCLDLIQAPFNVLDQRMAATGWLAKLHKAGIEVHARSIFLQGLLLMEDASRPPYFSRWRTLWDQWRKHLQNTGETPLQACLNFALSAAGISRVVVGVESRAQLQEIIRATGHAQSASPIEDLRCDDADLIAPSRWPTDPWKPAKT